MEKADFMSAMADVEGNLGAPCKPYFAPQLHHGLALALAVPPDVACPGSWELQLL